MEPWKRSAAEMILLFFFWSAFLVLSYLLSPGPKPGLENSELNHGP